MTKPLRDQYGYVPGGHPCTACGKRCWETRADAKIVARRTRSGGGPSRKGKGHLAVYRCPTTGWWHVGNLPPIVARGNATRDDLTQATPRTPAENRNRKDVA